MTCDYCLGTRTPAREIWALVSQRWRVVIICESCERKHAGAARRRVA